MMRRWLSLLALALAAPCAAQTVQQTGVVTPGHAAMWTTTGVVQDGGAATNGFLNNIGLFANGGLPDCITASTTALSLFSPASSPYTQFCLYANQGGNGGLTLNSYNGASPATLLLNINGTSYPFPGAGNGNVVGPVSAGATNVPVFNGATGTLLKDSGIPLAQPFADTTSIAMGAGALGAANAVNLFDYAIGINALGACTKCNASVAMGWSAGASFNLQNSGSGSRSSSFIGHVAGQWVLGDSSITCIGGFACRGGPPLGAISPAIQGAFEDTCLGEAACIFMNGNPIANTGLGFNALYAAGNGSIGNTAVGDNACLFITGTATNNCLGQYAGEYTHGAQNVFNGGLAGRGHFTFTTMAVNAPAGATSFTVVDASQAHVGDEIFSATTYVPTVVSAVDLVNNIVTFSPATFAALNATPVPFTVTFIQNPLTGQQNVALGFDTLPSLEGAASFNTASGSHALLDLTTGSMNTANGDSSCPNLTTGNNDLCIGFNVGVTLTTGSTNILIGNLSDAPAANTNNYLNIGNAIFCNNVNQGTLIATCGVGLSNPSTFFWEAKTLGVDTPSAATAGSDAACWNSSTKEITHGRACLGGSGSSPAVANCGMSPAISATATDTKGAVTAGSGGVTSCKVTFASAYATAPVCTITGVGTTTAVLSITSTSTTQLIVAASADISSEAFNYICLQ